MKVSQVIVICLSVGIGQAQVSNSAYRALGQADLRQNGVNRVYGVEMYAPTAIALDERDGTTHLYVADTRNNRVLAYQDVRSYQTGDPPAIILGQRGPQYSNPMGIGASGFNGPLGMAVHPITGDVYVADYGNNRILRFPKAVCESISRGTRCRVRGSLTSIPWEQIPGALAGIRCAARGGWPSTGQGICGWRIVGITGCYASTRPSWIA